MKEQLQASLNRVDTPEDIWEQAAEIQEALTEQAQHRSASIPDLIIAATARPAAWRSCTTTGTSTRSRAPPSSRHAGSSRPARSNPVASSHHRHPLGGQAKPRSRLAASQLSSAPLAG